MSKLSNRCFHLHGREGKTKQDGMLQVRKHQEEQLPISIANLHPHQHPVWVNFSGQGNLRNDTGTCKAQLYTSAAGSSSSGSCCYSLDQVLNVYLDNPSILFHSLSLLLQRIAASDASGACVTQGQLKNCSLQDLILPNNTANTEIVEGRVETIVSYVSWMH